MGRMSIHNQQEAVPIDFTRMREAARAVLEGEGEPEAEISLAFVDNATIHTLNKRYLDHDEPTDGGPQTFIAALPAAREHPILAGVSAEPFAVRSSLYKVSPLAADATHVVPGPHHRAVVDGDRAHGRVGEHEAHGKRQAKLRDDGGEIVPVRAEAVQPDDRRVRRWRGFGLDGLEQVCHASRCGVYHRGATLITRVAFP